MESPCQTSMEESFSEADNGLNGNYFHKTFHLKCLTGPLNISLNAFQKHRFLKSFKPFKCSECSSISVSEKQPSRAVQSVASIKLLCNFIESALRHRCTPENL